MSLPNSTILESPEKNDSMVIQRVLDRAKKNKIFRLYRISILFMPLSYATKTILGYKEMTWIDPTLILGAIVFLLLCLSSRRLSWRNHPSLFQVSAIFLLIYFVSSAVNGPLVISKGVYEIVREAIRLSLVFIYAYVTLYYAGFPKYRPYIYRSMGWGGCIQLCIAVYLILSAVSGLPIMASAKEYAVEYLARQSVWFAIPIPRLGGTFIESPPFGLYMLSLLYCSLLMFLEERSWLAVFFMVIGGIGTMGSLSDQIILGLFVSLGIYLISTLNFKINRGKLVYLTILLILLLAFLYYFAIPNFKVKLEALRNEDIYGSSLGERIYHTKYAFGLYLENVKNFFIGVGPGMYGFYISRTGMFPDTASPQLMFFEVLSEVGTLGFLTFILVMVFALNRLKSLHGPLGVAIGVGLIVAASMQASWKWTGPFFVVSLMLGFSSRGLSFFPPKKVRALKSSPAPSQSRHFYSREI